MSSPEQDYQVPQAVSSHPAWARLEDQRAYYDGKAAAYQSRYKQIKLGLIGLSAGIPLIVFLPGEAFKYVVAAVGVVIAMLEGLLLLNQYGPLWLKYRSTAEGLKRERWLLLAHAGGYAGKSDEEALRQLAEKVESLLEAENREWSGEQKNVLETLAKMQALVQASLHETRKRAADAAAATPAPEGAPPAP